MTEGLIIPTCSCKMRLPPPLPGPTIPLLPILRCLCLLLVVLAVILLIWLLRHPLGLEQPAYYTPISSEMARWLITHSQSIGPWEERVT